ncbi:DUF4411 family protein [Anaerocellum danielii]|uniref:DUF4411 family protein n=1 Tax=Anaerocellum danielii TaxID=1387557 RepID=A0ABZ0U0Q5_9FIRM|nr:DUF4411 family protein [Caldicellulosiruptor danielii]WPX07740.1 DUF4411 family protein [Caldicellulosiruptor danielii]
MSNNPIFVLDANVFIQAARQYYAFDLVPCFWDILKRYAQKGYICTIDFVKREIVTNKDQLANWFQNEFSNYCFDAMRDGEVVKAYREIIKWVSKNPQFKDEAKRDFASGADGWVIAYAMVHNCVVVTHERYDPNIKRKVPIPNVCREFDVSYIDTFDMMRKLEMKIC